MKTLITILLVLNMAMALATADQYLSSIPFQQEQFLDQHDITSETKNTENNYGASLFGTSHFLGSGRTRLPVAMARCDKYPKVCRAKGSPGPDCCKKRCVDTTVDRLNCGMCGKKCRFWEMCCKGKCVSPRSDERNCGSCGNRCKKGNSCVYGLCSYGN